MKAYRGNILFTPFKENFSVIPFGYVLVNDAGYVDSVYSADEFPKDKNLEIIDLGNQLLIPAMNDMHVHAPQFANMGLAMDMPLLPWLNNYTFPEEAKFADLEYAATVYHNFVYSLWLHGTMRASIFATIHISSTLLLADIFHKAGMGAYVGLVGMDRNAPENLCNQPIDFVRDMGLLIQHLLAYPLVQPILTPRFIPSCSPTLLLEISKLVEQYQLPIQSHLSENRNEIAWVKQLEPDTTCYSQAYNKYGLFNRDTLMAHCVHPTEADIQLLVDKQVSVVHCPTSNCNLSSGIAPIRQLIERGIDVVLGSDIAGGNDLSIFHVMRSAIQMSKLRYSEYPEQLPLTLPEVFYMATKAGGKFFGKVGSFEPGYAFDALVIDDTLINGYFANMNCQQRLERFIYMGNEGMITKRFCQGNEIVLNNC